MRTDYWVDFNDINRPGKLVLWDKATDSVVACAPLEDYTRHENDGTELPDYTKIDEWVAKLIGTSDYDVG